MTDLSLSTQLRIHDHLDQAAPLASETVAEGVRQIAKTRGLDLSEAQVTAIATQVQEGKAPVTTDMWERPGSRAAWERACATAQARVRRTQWMTSGMHILLPILALGIGGLLMGGLLAVKGYPSVAALKLLWLAGGMTAVLAWIMLKTLEREMGWGTAWLKARHVRAMNVVETLAPFDLRPDHLKGLLWVPGLPACLAQALEGEVPFLKLDLLQAHERRKAEVERRDAQRQAHKAAQRRVEAEEEIQAAHALVRQVLASKPIEA